MYTDASIPYPMPSDAVQLEHPLPSACGLSTRAVPLGQPVVVTKAVFHAVYSADKAVFEIVAGYEQYWPRRFCGNGNAPLEFAAVGDASQPLLDVDPEVLDESAELVALPLEPPVPEPPPVLDDEPPPFEAEPPEPAPLEGLPPVFDPLLLVPPPPFELDDAPVREAPELPLSDEPVDDGLEDPEHP